MFGLTKLFTWYHNAPVDGKIVGAREKSNSYAGAGDIITTKHVSALDLTPNQSYAHYEVVNPFATADDIGLTGVSANFKRSGWAKVHDVLHGQDIGMSTCKTKVVLEIGDEKVTLPLSKINMCIPEPA